MSSSSRPQTPDPAERAGRPVRRDARRNRDKLIAVAQAAFAAAEGPVSLEGIARRAGVGIGTLYRHFPTREDLVDAVYASELDAVTASAPDLLDRHPADIALRAWIGRYATFVATKRGMMDTLRTAVASGRIAAPSRERVAATIATILDQGAATGALRTDVDPDDVTTLLVGVFAAIIDGAPQERTDRLLDLLVDAVRPKAGARADS
ncbi:TetR/AcrR family transcriptional regulator [Streptomyces griseomycini]|uniref:AcrR family transcriptional regulator n=1 Tax=Streptomyces griseomycini TaxID=66895 RepID=A0A7W7PWW9_9ACTN|nr:TetR/AcrR family transcriptional regulator [Streptomyces griseomycini]MBB4902814.1 AcrR family transcriptional regulator [Streptomyces griseomycini]GGQ34550.1 TetR family transcriptional regulator [Streptomyces griseomycini]GGR51462.1 TetR family transcriptional regulator [Streptomyces griseomycini]